MKVQLALLSGVCFGTWPLFINKSNLSGLTSAFLLTLVSLLLICPFILLKLGYFNNVNWPMHLLGVLLIIIGILMICPYELFNLAEFKNANWLMFLIGASLSAIGIILFNTLLAAVDPKAVSLYFIVMVCVQISIPAIYYLVIEKTFSLVKLLGFCFAAAAAVLLSL